MEGYNQARSRIRRTLQYCTCFVNLALSVTFFLALHSSWKFLSPCFQRQAIVIMTTFIYWICRQIMKPSYLIESLQFLIVFGLTERLNFADQEVMSTCLQADSVLTVFIYTVYFFIFGYYVGTVIVFTLLLLIAIIHDCYFVFIMQPRIIRERSIRGKEFDDIETYQYVKPDHNVSEDQLVCSICLTEFHLQEQVKRLPVCWHLFHKHCIQEWLKNHRECPYCRADVRVNLRFWKASGKKYHKDLNKDMMNNNIRRPTIELSHSFEVHQDSGSGSHNDIPFQQI